MSSLTGVLIRGDQDTDMRRGMATGGHGECSLLPDVLHLCEKEKRVSQGEAQGESLQLDLFSVTLGM